MNRTDDDLGRLLRETFADAERLAAEPVAARPARPRLMVLAAAASVAVVTLVGATVIRAAGGDDPVATSPASTATVRTTPSPASTATPSPGIPMGAIARPAGATAIFAAVLRREFSREKLGFKVLWILDAPHVGVSPIDKTALRRGAPFDATSRAAIERALADLGRVRWVPDADAARVGGDCTSVRDKGVILTVGEIRNAGQHVEVGASSWFGCLGAHWGTYRLDPAADGAWRVTGTVGPEAVS
jgi:hypothetical protein